MGAYSTLCAFDVERLRTQVAPSVRLLLATGRRVAPMDALWQRHLDGLRESEAAHPAHYARHPKLSPELEALASGLGMELEAECALLDDTLAIASRPPAAMAEVVPSMRGACRSATCLVRARCPMHEAQTGPTRAEMFGGLIKDAVLTCCVADPPDIVLGRRGTAFDLARWHARAEGYDEGDDDAFLQHESPFVPLVTLLTHRAAAWGWGDGGYGEGVLGWLDAAEAAALAQVIDAYLAPSAPEDDGLQAMTRTLQGHAARCSDRGLGVLLRRD